MTNEEALITLYNNGTFLEDDSTGYGTVLKCAECNYAQGYYTSDPPRHSKDCQLFEALKMVKDLIAKNKSKQPLAGN